MRSRGAVALAELGRTQLDLAARLNVSSGIVAMWLSAQRTPGMPNRKAMHHKFGIPIESWDEDSEPEPEVDDGWGERVASSRLERLERLVDRELDRLENSAPTTMLDRQRLSTVITNLTSQIDTIRRLKGEDAPEVNVLKHPRWMIVRDHILNQLSEHPKALASVLDALEELEDVPDQSEPRVRHG